MLFARRLPYVCENLSLATFINLASFINAKSILNPQIPVWEDYFNEYIIFHYLGYFF